MALVGDGFDPKPSGQGVTCAEPWLEWFYDLLAAHGCQPSGARRGVALCAGHNDTNPSLSYSVADDGKVLIHCHAGCPPEAVCAALGISTRDLAPNGRRSEPAETRAAAVEPEPLPTENDLERAQERLSKSGLTERLRSERGWAPMAIVTYGLGLGDDGSIVFPFRAADGSLRTVERYFPFEHNGLKMIAAKGRPRQLLLPPGGASGEVFVCESRSDTIAAASRGLAGVGAPSASTWKTSYAEQLKTAGVTVAYIVGDCDDAGRKFAPRVAGSLASYGIETFTVDLDATRDDGFDLSDYLLAQDELPSSAIEDTLKRLAKPYADAGQQGDGERDWPALQVRRVPAFPVDALPPSVAAWVEATATHTQTPVDLPAFAALGVLSSAALGGAIVDCGQWEEELALYLLLALESGDRKSTVLRAAVKPLRALERERQEAAAPRLQQLQTRRTALEARIKKFIAQMGKADDGERAEAEEDYALAVAELARLPEAVAPRMFVNDATPEKLGSLLAEHGSLAVLAAESALIDNVVSGRYSDGAANLHLVCAAYSGEAHTIDRKSHETEQLDRPLLAITLTVQPHVLEKLISHDVARSQGFVARFAYALPETLLGRREVGAPTVPPDVAQAWTATVRRVAAVTASADNADNGQPATPKADISAFIRDGAPDSTVSIVSTSEPQRITLSPPARQLLSDLQRQLEPRLGPGGDLRPLADWAGRHHGRCVRVAALLHLCEQTASEPIGEQTMRDAIRIGDYLLANGIAAFAAPDELARRAARWLEQRGEPTVTQRDLHRGPLGSRGNAHDARTLADRLEGVGILRAVPGDHATSRRYEVHPGLVAAQHPERPPTPPELAR